MINRKMNRMTSRAGLTAALMVLACGTALAAPKTVAGPASDPQCMVPWQADTQFLQFTKKNGPYRIALANGYIANTWRIQMVQTAKAYASQPEVKAKLKEFKVVSTGEDVPAQISAINNFIDSGYDAIVVDAQNPTAFAPVIKRAKEAGVVLVAFDNTLNTTDAINVNVDQKDLGAMWGKWLVDRLPKGGKILEVRGVAGTSVDTDRHNGVSETLKASGKPFNVTEVVGKWDDGVAQKAAADAIATNGPFDGVTAQGGDTGVVRAMMDAKQPFVPFGGETENGFRKLCAQHSADGLKCISAGTGPAQVAVAIKVAIAALEGNVVPQAIKLPAAVVADPDLKKDADYYPDQSDNFFVGNAFPTCGINFTAQEIMSQTKD
jgi:ribose transport system substrate-binding protein